MVLIANAQPPIPAELIGEWRQPGPRGSYNGIYIRPDGRAGFIAAGDNGQVTTGGDGAATYHAFQRALTLTFADGPQKQFRFTHDAARQTLSAQSEPRGRAFKRHDTRIPAWLESRDP
jgi:hypothetical protein